MIVKACPCWLTTCPAGGWFGRHSPGRSGTVMNPAYRAAIPPQLIRHRLIANA
jgi:hypothetical protein